MYIKTFQDNIAHEKSIHLNKSFGEKNRIHLGELFVP